MGYGALLHVPLGILYTDHKPLENLEKVRTKILNRLQEAMQTFDFEIIYKKGSKMPAYLSCNTVDAISWQTKQKVFALSGTSF
jgi:hypothetical protein